MTDRPMLKLCYICGKKRAVICGSIRGVPVTVNGEKRGVAGIAELICRHCGAYLGEHGPIYGESVGEGEVKPIIEITDQEARPIVYRVIA